MENPSHHSRQQLSRWYREQGENFFNQDLYFQTCLELFFPKATHEELWSSLTAFGLDAASIMNLAAIENNQPANRPRLERYDAVGNRDERILHHPSYRVYGEALYRSGIISCLKEPGNYLKSLCFFYLSSQNGEAGHNCPIACTAGAVRSLQKSALPEKEAYLKRLLDPDYSENAIAAQFVTEIQGGSDVGQNGCVAKISRNGHYLISGEKWFCSVADADYILLTARFDDSVKGTRGIGLFFLPKYLEDGGHNHYRIRRLKDKLGTCSLASAEIDFEDALAFAVTPPQNGFKFLMENVIQLSRLYKAVKARGRQNQLFIVGADGNKSMLKLIKKGTSSCRATILYPPQMTGDATKLIYLAAQGRGIPGFFSKEIPVHMKIKTSLVTGENVEKFWDLGF